MLFIGIDLSARFPTEYSVLGYSILDKLMHYKKRGFIYELHLVKSYTQINSIYQYNLLRKAITANWILLIKGTDFQRRISA